MSWQQTRSGAVYNSIIQISWLPAPAPQQKGQLPPSLVVSPVSPPAWVIIDGGTAAGLPPQPAVSTVTSDIVTLAWYQLQDITGIRWDYIKLLRYLNLGILEILNLKPEAYPSTVNIVLVPGPAQFLPSGAIALIDAGYNLLSGGIIGNAITTIKKEILDDLLPGWTTFPVNITVMYVVYDLRNPKVFYVFPPQPPSPPGPASISAILTMPPAKLQSMGDVFPLDDSYKPACLDYLIFRALAEETTIPNSLTKANAFFQKFLQDLGLKSNVEKSTEAEGR